MGFGSEVSALASRRLLARAKICRQPLKTSLRVTAIARHETVSSERAAQKAFLMIIRFKMSKASVFTCLLSLIALASVSAQLAPTHKVPRNEPLERYDNPPAPPRKIETSPRMISQFGPFTSHQANVDANGQNILGDAANECAISVDPTDGNKMTIAWRQFNDVTSNFRQGRWVNTRHG